MLYTAVSLFCVAEGRIVNERSEGAVLCDPVIGVDGLTRVVLLLLNRTGKGGRLWEIALLPPVPVLICAVMNAG